MSNAIGIVITDHIVAGRLEDQKLAGTLLRFPEGAGKPDVLNSIPVGELVAMFCQFVTALAAQTEGPLDAIGWAHGTKGIARGCAPSVEGPFVDVPAVPELIAAGWAYVATDYVGLGTDGGHAYLVGDDAARSGSNC